MKGPTTVTRPARQTPTIGCCVYEVDRSVGETYRRKRGGCAGHRLDGDTNMRSARDHRVMARERPVVWYLAAGYRRAGGVEVYLLHYASEMRRQGFDTRIVVFEPLPWKKHRCLVALEQHGIRIESLFSRCMAASILRAGATWLPCCVRNLLLGRKWPGRPCRG